MITGMKESIRSEINGLMKRVVFKAAVRLELPEDANILVGRFVLAIKDLDTAEESYKAIFVVQGHLDRDKPFLVHASPNLRQDSVRMMFAIASLIGFRVWTEDISQAYFQDSAEVMQQVYMDPRRKEFHLKPGDILQLMKPLYELADSVHRWHHTMKHHFLNDMG